jgi:hypothetical protein
LDHLNLWNPRVVVIIGCFKVAQASADHRPSCSGVGCPYSHIPAASAASQGNSRSRPTWAKAAPPAPRAPPWRVRLRRGPASAGVPNAARLLRLHVSLLHACRHLLLDPHVLILPALWSERRAKLFLRTREAVPAQLRARELPSTSPCCPHLRATLRAAAWRGALCAATAPLRRQLLALRTRKPRAPGWPLHGCVSPKTLLPRLSPSTLLSRRSSRRGLSLRPALRARRPRQVTANRAGWDAAIAARGPARRGLPRLVVVQWQTLVLLCASVEQRPL